MLFTVTGVGLAPASASGDPLARSPCIGEGEWLSRESGDSCMPSERSYSDLERHLRLEVSSSSSSEALR